MVLPDPVAMDVPFADGKEIKRIGASKRAV